MKGSLTHERFNRDYSLSSFTPQSVQDNLLEGDTTLEVLSRD
jgi:hypothetical protein